MRDLISKFLRYVLTGGIAAIIDVGGFALLLRTGLAIPVAGATSFCAAAGVNYLLTSRFVFRRASHSRGFAVFLGMATLGLLVNVGVTWVAAEHLPIAPVIAKILGVGVAFLLNFFLNTFVVFSARVHGAPLQVRHPIQASPAAQGEHARSNEAR